MQSLIIHMLLVHARQYLLSLVMHLVAHTHIYIYKSKGQLLSVNIHLHNPLQGANTFARVDHLIEAVVGVAPPLPTHAEMSDGVATPTIPFCFVGMEPSHLSL